MLRLALLGTLLLTSAASAIDISTFVTAHCLKCHGADKQSGGVRFDDLPVDVAKARERWATVRDQVRDGLMPPPKQPRPDARLMRNVVASVTAELHEPPARLPNQGNLVPHELLFGKTAPVFVPSKGRVWRLSPDGYMGFVREAARGRVDGLIQPFTLTPERGIKDFSGLYTIDEPSTEILLRNAEAIVASQTAHDIKDGKFSGRNDTVRELVSLMEPNVELTRVQLETGITVQFRMAIGRTPTADELERFLAFYRKCAKDSSAPEAARTMLQAILLRTDAMFRSEIGKGQMLAPDELVRALSLALSDRRESGLVQAAGKGELATKEQIAKHLQRMLDDPKFEKPRILRFFREYFEYHRALDVFKEKPKTFVHEPRTLVNDTDRLVLHIVAQDKDVLRELLTTPLSFVNYSTKQNKQTRKDEPVPAVTLNPYNNKGQTNVETVYGLSEWPKEQPAPLPADQRFGILMQPSWLIAFSTNFANDPVRRGRWVRERLLGGTVADLPIGVVAQVPDDPHRTFRDRLTVTRDAKCWKCHQRMDDLGLPFEHFDHFGRFRKTETVLDPDATAKNLDKKGKPLGPVMREAELNSTGVVADSGDPKLDGMVHDPREMLRKLAKSDRVRQVFIRHAFRYFLGRNETLVDAQTLQDADRAYVESGGSFKVLVIVLLTSDSFLYRSTPGANP